ncbi:uncharacterized protein M421DRAFT_424917 [Didymella exigua CBS 183.55]|uniref:Secreted protein n=1 Tax=Didymella exigua CBS 183.55 TaxID=1150837 RepID=A0A6A5RAQ5_9PLEO|nr:uncharacterized protein M421DRAFT_424917 [Didymella exigua CBS 183.55]KAF1924278.1 hypothetical protein M421DRAFT_424917 [Didymella exigua CBS 183.55]
MICTLLSVCWCMGLCRVGSGRAWSPFPETCELPICTLRGNYTARLQRAFENQSLDSVCGQPTRLDGRRSGGASAHATLVPKFFDRSTALGRCAYMAKQNRDYADTETMQIPRLCRYRDYADTETMQIPRLGRYRDSVPTDA